MLSNDGPKFLVFLDLGRLALGSLPPLLRLCVLLLS